MQSDSSERKGGRRINPEFWVLALLVCCAFLFRLAMATTGGLNAAPVAGTDAEEYDTYAWNLARGLGYRGMSPDVADQDHLTAYRPPGPSLTWAACYSTFGHRFDVIRVMNCILGSASVWLVYRIGRRLFSTQVGIFAAIGYSVYPMAVLQSGDLLSEPLGVFLFLLFLDITLSYVQMPTWQASFFAGGILGLALLTRANYILFVPFYVIWSVWQFRGKWRQLTHAVLVLLVAAATMLPWIVRNQLVFHRLIPFSTMGGSVLLQGNNRLVVTEPSLYGYNIWDTKIPEYREALQSAGNEVERDRRAKEFAITWLRENRDQWGFLVWHKFIRSWTPFLTNNPSASHRLVYLCTWGPVLLLFCIAIVPTFVSSLRNGSPAWLLHLAVLHYVANSLIFFAYIRYRAPIDPICLIFAAWTANLALTALRLHFTGAPASPSPTTN